MIKFDYPPVYSFLCSDGYSDKWWTVTYEDDSTPVKVVSAWGRFGSRGQTAFHNFASVDRAQKYIEKKCKEKIKKNYFQVPECWVLINELM